jgi:HSP20 family molecular chaperone IbpA
MFLTTLNNNDIFSTYDALFNGLTKRPSRQSFRKNNDFYVFDEGSVRVVELVAPGLKSEDFDITIDDNKLSIDISTKKDDNKRSFIHAAKYETYLGNDINLDNVDATYEAGVLRINVPLLKKHEMKKIAVK